MVLEQDLVQMILCVQLTLALYEYILRFQTCNYQTQVGTKICTGLSSFTGFTKYSDYNAHFINLNHLKVSLKGFSGTLIP
jgi:hypothetical protein